MTPLDQERLHRLSAAAAALGEYFDSVRIFATVHDAQGDETRAYTRASGNRYASELQVREWVDLVEASAMVVDDNDGD